LKFFLVAKNADAKVLLYFGVPAVIFAFLGAYLLGFLSAIEVLYEYILFDKNFVVTPIKFVIGILILFFVLIELLPYFSKMSIVGNKLLKKVSIEFRRSSDLLHTAYNHLFKFS
jgi:hypothetical protein